MLLRRLPMPERYTSEATINAFGFFIAKKEVFSPLPNPISRIIFSKSLANSNSSFEPAR
jgi:hypothetical protein